MQNNTLQEQHKDQWQKILLSSKTLLKAAQEENWDDLSDQAAERDYLIREYFSKPLTVDNALKMHDQIVELLAIDDQILGLARKEQGNSLPTLKKIAKGKKAINAYNQHR